MAEMTVSKQKAKPGVVDVYKGRLTEDFLVQQHEYHIELETFQIRRTRLEASDTLYLGGLNKLFPDETALTDRLYVENTFKNALHDHTRLASEGRAMPRFIERGDRTADKLGARVREAICDTYWVVNRGKYTARRWYMDLAGTGVMAAAAYYNNDSVYPQVMRLDPRFCYPDVRNGKLTSMFYVETMKERVAAVQWPDLGLNASAKRDATVDFIAYYDKNEVVEAFIRRGSDKIPTSIYIVQRWKHDLGRVPVAYHQLTTFDGAARGMFDQMAGPMMVRQKAVRFIIDYMEQAAYSPLFALNIENATDTPGPTTVYRGDPDAEPGTVHLERIGPATAGSTMWNLISYMGEQESRESIQPAGRQGTLPQSQASGSFSNSTQGMLTSVVIEMQEGMSDFREQLDMIWMMIDEQHLDVQKPLVRAVQKKKTYKPSKDIDGWYYHTVEYGAGAGMNKNETDNRLINLLSARILDRGTAMENVDFLDDSSSIQEKIDAENVGDALLERFATDPTTPLSSLAKLHILMEDEGMSKIEALKVVAPELFQAEQQAAQAQGAPPVPGPEGVPPEATAAVAEGALPAPGQGETPVPELPRAPMSQVFVNSGNR